MGKGGPAIPPVDHEGETTALIRLERERAAIAEEQRQAELAREAAERERQLGIFNEDLNTAYSSARNTGLGEFERRGLDIDRFSPILDTRLTNIRSSVPRLDTNPAAYFQTSTLIDDIINSETNLQRQNYGRQVDNFAGSNFAVNRLPDTLDDSVINDIIAEQFGDASASITRARERGNLNDFGFQTALSNLETQRGAASSRLQDLGLGLIESGRGELRDIGSQARARAEGYNFGDNLDLGGYESRINDRASSFSSGIGGSLRNALGGESLFDVNSILGRGFVAQGAVNEGRSTPTLSDALRRRDDEGARGRGLGNQGVF